MSILGIFATTFGIIMALGYFPQAWKMFKTKSVKDISLLSFSIFFIGNVAWEIYGLSIRDYPLIITPVVGITGTTLILIFYFRYKGKNNDKEDLR